jgi:hypothetical protein
MAESKSIVAYQIGQESQHKFDYFITGITGAIFAYVSQAYVPHRIGLDYSVIEPIAMLFLAASFFMGLKRIESTAAVIRLNHKMLQASEKAASITDKVGQPGTGIFVHNSGNEFTREQLIERRKMHLAEAEAAESLMQSLVSRGSRYYVLRDWSLVAGFLAIVVAKILLPYAKR